jgi:hypothetical protein
MSVPQDQIAVRLSLTRLSCRDPWCCEMDDQLDVLNERERDFVDDMAWKLRINDRIKKQ